MMLARDRAAVRIAEPHRSLQDHIEDRLNVGRRTADDIEHLADGRLILQGLL